ncbi:calcium and calcium/calmodulin-dependent serine/threonine-protein kinase-like [Macadamia integrifolia]|uniref:calcium and calcium/calmodulin-dependent serine/threonine-protein kinase-like n=1 Tax=Macadamia integrifolia TaxID=60698 RepID=UPI001C4E5D8E|nr:calcium and calcium/calmodulin-dependent serine/threonine-protein kinase-like [Macadamia integrifolia]
MMVPLLNMRHEIRRLSDDYDIANTLGRGGFSVVRRGVRKNSGGRIQVAIKTLRRVGNSQGMPSTQTGETSTASVGFPVSEALVRNEILVMKKIARDISPHPNVIHLYNIYDDPNGVHIVLELCSGGELFDRIVSQGRYSEKGAAAVVQQIANGLSALHRANIVHRDLKPENCLFLNTSEDSPLKIMDFGLSSVNEFTDPIVGLFGSIDYVSPETLSQQRISSATDMWSLGVLLYILLSGYPPFYAKSNRQKQRLILTGEFSFDEHSWQNISSSAKQLISNLLVVDPCRRPTAQELLLHPWVTGASASRDLMDFEIVSRLQNFNARRKFRAAAIASVCSIKVFFRIKKLRDLVGSHDLTREELEKLGMHFKKMCSNGASATLPEFEKVISAMDLSSILPLAPRIFDIFDSNHDGTVDMREILCGFSTLRKSQGDDSFRLCFQMYDIDKSGCITKDEVASLLRALPEDCLPADITEPGKLDEIFDEMDANNDGKVTFEEFKAAMKRDCSLQDAVLSSLRAT